MAAQARVFSLNGFITGLCRQVNNSFQTCCRCYKEHSWLFCSCTCCRESMPSVVVNFVLHDSSVSGGRTDFLRMQVGHGRRLAFCSKAGGWIGSPAGRRILDRQGDSLFADRRGNIFRTEISFRWWNQWFWMNDPTTLLIFLFVSLHALMKHQCGEKLFLGWT